MEVREKKVSLKETKSYVLIKDTPNRKKGATVDIHPIIANLYLKKGWIAKGSDVTVTDLRKPKKK